jgi:hypothetical protein
MIGKTVKLIHEGRYAAEVPVDLIADDTGWSPYLSLEDAKKLDTSLALRKGEIAEAAKHGRVFELTPISPDNAPWDAATHALSHLYPVPQRDPRRTAGNVHL